MAGYRDLDTLELHKKHFIFIQPFTLRFGIPNKLV